MSLLEEWEAGTVYHEPAHTDDSSLQGRNTEPLAQPSLSSESIFGIQTIERQIARWRLLLYVLSLHSSCTPTPSQFAHIIQGQRAGRCHRCS